MLTVLISVVFLLPFKLSFREINHKIFFFSWLFEKYLLKYTELVQIFLRKEWLLPPDILPRLLFGVKGEREGVVEADAERAIKLGVPP